MKKALFLDRDGIINEVVKKLSVSHKKVIDDSPFNLSELRFVLGIKELVQQARGKGYKPLIITNQPSILKGECSLRDYEEITTEICIFLGLKRGDVFECLHKEGFSLKCNCRKPAPDLFLMAKGVHNIDLKKSVMIGDSWKDILSAKSVGIGKTIFLKRKETNKQLGNLQDQELMKEKNIFPDYFCDNLFEVIKALD